LLIQRTWCTGQDVLAGAARTVTEKLQRVLNAAARVITGTRKFDRGLGEILHDQLHWLDVPERVLFKLAVTIHQCLNGRICRSTASRSPMLTRAGICVPPTVTYLPHCVSIRLYSYGRRAFSVAGAMAWNSLPDFINKQHKLFRRLLKTYFFARY